jgi:hypothetical protein
MDISSEALAGRITALMSGYASYSQATRRRQEEYLRAFAPPYIEQMGQHDQWPEPLDEEDVDHTRSSFNLTRPTVELWASLEAGLKLPPIRWEEELLLPPPPVLNDPTATAKREEAYASDKLIARNRASMREAVLLRKLRLAKFARHWYRVTRRKNLYGHSWLRAIPDRGRQTFLIKSSIDNATVIPVWQDAEEDEAGLDSILVVSRRSAAKLAAQWPAANIQLAPDGLTGMQASLYQPTAVPRTEQDLRYVWVEDLWVRDPAWFETTETGKRTKNGVTSRVVNAIRVNGVVVQVVEWPGWKVVPYFLFQNDNLRDRDGFSDAGEVLAIQEAINHMTSEQGDVIAGGARPKHKFRAEPNVVVPQLNDEGIIHIGPDEDFEQLRETIDGWPTQAHGTLLMVLLGMVSGLPDAVWGKINQAQNSGKALASSWRAVGARLIPRMVDNGFSLDNVYGFMLDCMELYDWDGAKALYQGNRDFEIDFPNQEPRDFNEVSLDAINRMNAGILDHAGAMELTDVQAPDEMLERVRRDKMDRILDPAGAQQQRMIDQLDQQIAIQGMQAQQQMQQSAMVAGANVAQNQAATNQAATQAQQQAAPDLQQGQQAPATQQGAPGNPAQVSSMLQNGQVSNRMILGG